MCFVFVSNVLCQQNISTRFGAQMANNRARALGFIYYIIICEQHLGVCVAILARLSLFWDDIALYSCTVTYIISSIVDECTKFD